MRVNVPDTRRRMAPGRVGVLMAPIPALTIGLVVMSRAGVPAAIWSRNLAAAAVGVLLVMAASGRGAPGSVLRRWLVGLGLTLLGATLIAPGVEGVHRWVGLGPLEIHVGAVLLPWLLVLLSQMAWASGVSVGLLTLGILVLQPDGAQAAAFAGGWAVWLAMRYGRAAAWPLTVAALPAGAAWLRHDPLEPVTYVEGIVGVAAEQGAIWTAMSLFALALLPLPFLLAPERRVGVALAVYMTGTLMAAWLGDYPVPVLGYGVSPILGYALAGLASTRTVDPASAGSRCPSRT